MTDTSTPATSGAIVIPEAAARFPAATTEELDQAVATVGARKDDWVAVSIADRIRIIDEIITSIVDVSERWARTAGELAGIRPGSAYEGEDMAWGPYAVIRPLRLMRQTLVGLRDTGAVQTPGEPYARPDGQVAVPVLPASWIDRALFPMTTGEIRVQRDVTLDTLLMGRAYLDKQPGRLCFILGAGNNVAVPFNDVMQKLFVEDQVCVLKMNPVNEVLGPIIRLAMAPLVREGYVRIVHGGVQVGQYLTEHPDVDTLHMTGSDKTHDAIVYGVGEEGARRKAADEPVNDKPFSAELGSVSPVIVVPGEWSDDDLEYQAKHVHAMINSNGGFNCGSMRVLMTHAAWPQREAFLAHLRRAMAEAEDRKAFYPGARERWETFTKAHPDAVWFGNDKGDNAPITMLPDLDEEEVGDIAFTCESFNGVFGELPLTATDAVDFLAKAVDFANEHLWGSLGATIIVHPKTVKDERADRAVEQAVTDLRAGTVGVNIWALTSYGIATTTWGAFPGHPRNDIQSGNGVVGNTFMIDKVEKSVIRAPFRLGKKPPGSHDFSTFGSLARRLVQLEAYGDAKQLPGIVLDGIKA